MRKIAFVFGMIFCLSLVSAKIPEYQDLYVNDFAGVLPSADAQLLRDLFTLVEQNTTAEVVFVSLETIDGNAIDEYAVDIGENWGVGKEDKDNGVVILYVADINRIFVATGYGVEGILPDSKVGRLLDENYVPYRDMGNVSEGIVEFSFALSEELFANSWELQSARRSGNNDVLVVLFIAFIFIFIFLVIITATHSKKKYGKSSRWFPVFVPTGFGGRSSGGGFSSGGGSFGGGSFGGGGAGR